jgi:hypothetical protein
MPLLQPTNPITRLLRVVNLVAAFVLALVLIWILIWSAQSRESSGDAEIRKALSQSSLPIWNLLAAELEQAQHDVVAIAGLATHIFTNPESYRLAAQPSEYGHDETTGIYGSVRNDGLSVVLLSAATSLNPEILRDIRLSEYLNPLFKTVAGINPIYGQISVFTTDSLIRSYPWFEVKCLIASRVLKRDFSAKEIPAFAKAAPPLNPDRRVICEAARADLNGSAAHVVCSAPFFAGDVFRGVVAISIDGNKLARRIFDKADFQRGFALLLGRGNVVLGMSRALEHTLSRPELQKAGQELKNLAFKSASGMEPVFRYQVSGDGNFGRHAGFVWLITSSETIPAKLMAILPEAEIATFARASTGSLPRRWVLSGTLICGLLLVLNAGWMLRLERNLGESARKMGESQREGLLKLEMLRREYCLGLSKAVEAPLDKIRVEVQSIYSRLGRLTPHYKQHCETILFEVGKLYEIVREARELEPIREIKTETERSGVS